MGSHPPAWKKYSAIKVTIYESSLQNLNGQSPTGMEKILSHKGDETHAIRLTDQEDFIGWITLQKNIDGQPDVGISLIADQQNKGYGPEAVMLFVRFTDWSACKTYQTTYFNLLQYNLPSACFTTSNMTHIGHIFQLSRDCFYSNTRLARHLGPRHMRIYPYSG